MITIRYAEKTDDEITRLFAFLALMATPVVLESIERDDALDEIHRVIDEDVAIIAEVAGEIVGSLGLVQVQFWYNRQRSFLTDRWYFLYPQLRGRGVGARLLAEAGAIGLLKDQKVVITGHLRQRAKGIGHGVYFNKPLVIKPDDVEQTDWNEAELRLLPAAE